MAKKALLFLTLLILMFVPGKAQVRPVADTLSQQVLLKDSLIVDSANVIAVDTLTPQVLKKRDSLTNAQWLDSLNNGYGFEVFSLQKLINIANNSYEKVVYQHGNLLPKGEVWV
ncbi:MAG: hypothetical protein EOO07_32325, partial [Chitinophagaceae bacterium]